MQQIRLQHSLPPLTHPSRGHLIAAGDTVPTDGVDGYCAGCLFFHMDGSGNGSVLYVNVGDKDSANFDPIYGFAQGAALTAQDTTITHTAPGTADYAIQDLTSSGGFGFATKDEGNTVLQVIANLQTRLAEVEARLEAAGIIAAN